MHWVLHDGKLADFGATGPCSITGGVTLAGAGSVFKNHNRICGDVTVGGSETLTNTGIIHGDVTLGASDTINDSRGEITDAITASSNDTFVDNGLFGTETIDDFVAGRASTHDTIQFAANDFGAFAAVQGAILQVGADTLIRLDASEFDHPRRRHNVEACGAGFQVRLRRARRRKGGSACARTLAGPDRAQGRGGAP